MKESIFRQVVNKKTAAYFLHQLLIGGFLLLRLVCFQFVYDFLAQVQFYCVDQLVVFGHCCEELFFVQVLLEHLIEWSFRLRGWSFKCYII